MNNSTEQIQFRIKKLQRSPNNMPTIQRLSRGRPPKMSYVSYGDEDDAGSMFAIQLTVHQSRYLVYVTIKNMIKHCGAIMPKGAKMPLGFWMEIADELNAMPGMNRPAKQWARCYVSKKHFVATKFKNYVKNHLTSDANFQPDWTKFTILDLLLIQDCRCDYPDMPNVRELMQLIERKNILEIKWNARYPGASKEIAEDDVDFDDQEDTNMSAHFLDFMDHEQSEEIPIGLANDENTMGQRFDCDETTAGAETTVTKFDESANATQWIHTGPSPYLAYLAYVAVKFLVKLHGANIPRNSGLSLRTWSFIAERLLTKYSIAKSPKKWRKAYSANKYIAQTRFMRRRNELIELNENAQINWSQVRVGELLFLLDLRVKGFPDMPDANSLLKAYENNERFLNWNGNITNDLPQTNNCAPQHDSVAGVEDQQEEDEEECMDDHNSSWHATYEMDPVDIKSEPFSEYAEEITSDLQPTLLKDEQTTTSKHMQQNNKDDPLTNSMFASQKRNKAAANSKLNSAANTPQYAQQPAYLSAGYVTRDEPEPEQYYLERRLLEINEQMLGEKIKKNKLMRKKNKILKEHTKLFGKLLNKMDALINLKST